jgi:hypothetical protein
MLERETEHIIEVLRRRTIGQAYGISVKEILAADVPQPFKAFFRTEVSVRLENELRVHRASTRFDYSSPDVLSLEQQVHSILILNYAFPREEFLKRLDDTAHLLINYLLRPQWTLSSALFEREERIPVRAVRRFMSYLSGYDYLREIFERYADERRIEETGRDDFSRLIWKIDAEFVKRKTGRELAHLLLPMYGFFAIDSSADAYRMPVAALMKFFEDKGLTTVVTRLEGERLQSVESVTHGQLTSLLEDVRTTSGAFEAHQRETERPAPVVADAPAPAMTEARTAVPAMAEARASGLSSAPVPSRPAAQPFIHFDFLGTINDGDRKKFVKRIFKHDDGAYQHALQSMNSIASWKQASKMIDEIFIENDVDPYCSEAMKFIDIIFQQYHPKR